jgi:hypothetical protein
VATILAHAGFECANESVLETLTDVAHEYCLKFTKLLRFAVDREALMGQTPFPDVMEQVFHEVGIGSVLSLQKFWQHRIKDYHSYMLQVRSLRENWGLGVFIRIPQYLLDYAEHREQSEFNILFSWSQLCSIGLITDLATYQSLL